MGYYYKLDGDFEEFEGKPYYRGDNKFYISKWDFPFSRRDWLNTKFHKSDDGIYLEYKYYGENSNGERRNQVYRRYISLENLQSALNKSLGYERRILSIETKGHFFECCLICEENSYTRKIDELEKQLKELSDNLDELKKENEQLEETIESKIYSAKNDLLRELYFKSEEIIEFIEKQNEDE